MVDERESYAEYVGMAQTMIRDCLSALDERARRELSPTLPHALVERSMTDLADSLVRLTALVLDKRDDMTH